MSAVRITLAVAAMAVSLGATTPMSVAEDGLESRIAEALDTFCERYGLPGATAAIALRRALPMSRRDAP